MGIRRGQKRAKEFRPADEERPNSPGLDRILIALVKEEKISLSVSPASWKDAISLPENAIYSLLKLCVTFKAVFNAVMKHPDIFGALVFRGSSRCTLSIQIPRDGLLWRSQHLERVFSLSFFHPPSPPILSGRRIFHFRSKVEECVKINAHIPEKMALFSGNWPSAYSVLCRLLSCWTIIPFSLEPPALNRSAVGFWILIGLFLALPAAVIVSIATAHGLG